MRLLLRWMLAAGTISLASANTIPVFSTGNGSTTDNTVDPNWTYTNSGSVTNNARVAANAANNGSGDFWSGGGGLDPWLANTSSSAWIVDNTANSQSGGLPLSFQTTFSLAGLISSTASITLEWAVDDGGNLLLNGVVVASLPGQNDSTHWNQLHTLTLNSGFLAGTNTLHVSLTDDNNNYEGARVQIDSATATATAAKAPEPAAGVLCAAALAALWAARKAFRQRFSARS